MKKLTIYNNDIALEVRELGPEESELIILLHGFPECWNTWRHQIKPLADAGYRVCVPNLRGYGQSSKPKSIKRYRLDELITDVEAIRLHYGKETFHLVGHDWGAAIAWWYAIHNKQPLASLSILNVPHPYAFLKALKSSVKQLRKSWYIFFFQLPFIPIWALTRNRFASLRKTLTHTSSPGAYTEEDFIHLEEAWSAPGAIKSMISYYRAMLRYARSPKNDGVISTPTQILWGERDLALSLASAHDSATYLQHGKLITYPEATHWLAHDLPDEISQKLIEHLNRYPAL